MGGKRLKFTLRVEKELLLKFQYVAEYNANSVNQELTELVKQHIDKFETEVEKVPSDWLEEKQHVKSKA